MPRSSSTACDPALPAPPTPAVSMPRSSSMACDVRTRSTVSMSPPRSRCHDHRAWLATLHSGAREGASGAWSRCHDHRARLATTFRTVRAAPALIVSMSRSSSTACDLPTQAMRARGSRGLDATIIEHGLRRGRHDVVVMLSRCHDHRARLATSRTRKRRCGRTMSRCHDHRARLATPLRPTRSCRW
jgi:hypothetical protein